MYCEDSAGSDIDHFWPKISYPDHCFLWSNYFLACSHCNSNEKRGQFPVDEAGAALLLDPSQDDPCEHFVLVPETGRLEPMTVRGEATERVFGLNRREDLTQGRADAWTQMVALIRDYGQAMSVGDREAELRIVETVKRLSFQAAVQYFLAEAQRGSKLVPVDVAQIVARSLNEWCAILR